MAREAQVPRTHVLAHVASIDTIADPLAQLERNLLAQLDREVRDAPSRIELSRRRDRPRRARVETPGARPAAIRLERRVDGQLEIEHERTEEDE